MKQLEKIEERLALSPGHKKTKFDTAKVLELRFGKRMSYQEIAAFLGVHPSAVHTRVKRFIRLFGELGDVEAYRENEVKLLDAASYRVITHLLEPETLKKASANNLAYVFTQLFNARRLLRGESTANVGLNAKLITQIHTDLDTQGSNKP
jgi:predicted DNA-binding protein YlxM (UPF0122 family)